MENELGKSDGYIREQSHGARPGLPGTPEPSQPGTPTHAPAEEPGQTRTSMSPRPLRRERSRRPRRSRQWVEPFRKLRELMSALGGKQTLVLVSNGPAYWRSPPPSPI